MAAYKMRPTALEIYRRIRKAGCGIDYALKLSQGKAKLKKSKKLSEREQKQLEKMLSPAVSAIQIGPKDRSVSVGGEEVLFRHEYRFVNQTALFIEVDDLMPPAKVRKRISFVKGFVVERVGQRLRLDGIALRAKTNDPKRFMRLVKIVKKSFDGPIVVIAPKKEVLEPALKTLEKKQPLIYLEKEDSSEAAVFAAKYWASFVVRSDNPVKLASLGRKLSGKGSADIVYDASGRRMEDSLRNFTYMRKAAVEGRKGFGHPLMCILSNERDPFNESLLACALLCRYASILVLRTIEPWAVLPVLTLRQGLYSDPRAKPMVEPGIHVVGSPGRDSPLIVTSNFALTYHSVYGDLEKAKISCYLLALDTEGLAVTVSVAADKFTASLVKEALKEYQAEKRVSHRRLIIPGFAAQLAEGIREETGWDVVVGPEDSSKLGEFLKSL